MDNQPLIAVRIKDGIFIGNVTAAHDEDFLLMNKVTHIVNCAGSEVRDLYENIGIQYLTFPWKDAVNSTVCSTVMFDSADRNIENTLRFVDKGLSSGECVLIHSYFGVSRACALAAAYMIVKYGWNLENTLRFMEMAHQDMNIKPYFMRQLRGFAKRHEVQIDVFDPRVDEQGFALDNDQWMLRNTFVNGLVADIQEKHDLYKTASSQIKICEPNYKNSQKRRRRIVFCDTKQGSSVHSTVTQPLAQGAGKISHYVDPTTGQQCVVSRAAQNNEVRSILARRGVPNSHQLESANDVNARGRQVLVLRQSGGPAVNRSTLGAGLPEAPRNTTPVPTARTEYVSSNSTVQTPQQYGVPRDPRDFREPRDSRDPPAQQSQQPQPQTANPARDSPQVRQPAATTRVSPAEVPRDARSLTQPNTRPGANTAPPRRSGLVTSPFTLTSASQQRRGSPLPLNRQPSGRTTTQQPTSSYRASPTSHSGTPVHPGIAERGRNSSPMQRRTATAQPQATGPRTGSPMRGPAQDSSSYHTLSAPNRASPTSHYVFQSVPHASATVSQGNPTATGGTIMRGNPNAPIAPGARTGSPVGRRATTGGTQPGGSPLRATAGQPRGSSPQGRTAGGSPMRQGSLAEQYLSGGNGGGSRGYQRDTTSSYLRKPR